MTVYLIQWLRSEDHLTLKVTFLVFVVYVVTSFVFVPRAPVLIATGGIFGWQGLPIVIVGANVGCILAFLVARYVAARWFQQIVSRKPLSHAVALAVDREGWRIVALVRLAGPAPAGLVSYAFGVSNIGFGTYTLCTLIFSAPAIVFYTYLGAAGRSAIIDDGMTNISQISLVLGLIVSGMVVSLVARATRSELGALQANEAGCVGSKDSAVVSQLPPGSTRAP
jgi:uncharacterized membrane protein YdjX (TVP38/TMEM64 family)